MLLRLLMGEVGSGKTHWIHRKILSDGQGLPQERNILIVPEQVTLSEQKTLIQEHPGHGLIGTDVLSFQRLAHRVLSEQGEKELVVLDEVGKSMLLYRLAQEHAPQLAYYGGSVHSAGFLQRLKSLFSEFAQYEISQETLQKAMEQTEKESSLHLKLQDLVLLHGAYEEALLQYGEISEKLLDRLAENLPDSHLVRGARIYVDDFYGFTPQQLRVLTLLMHYAGEVTISLTIPEAAARAVEREQESEKGDLFDTSRRTLAALYEAARQMRIPVQEVYMHAAEETCLNHTAREFFKVPPRPWSGEKNAVHLYAAAGCRAEVQRMFEQIVYLIREQGYQYRQIGVAVSDAGVYQGLIRQYAQEYGFPIFMDETGGVMSHPFIRMIRSLLQMLQSRCSYDTLFSFLKSGYTPFTRKQRDLLENQALARGTRGFHKAAELMRECAVGSENEQAVRLYTDCLETFWQDAQDKTAEKWCSQIESFLEATGAEYLLNHQADQLRRDGLFLQEAHSRQIYAQVIQVLERIREMMGETELSTDAFLGILTAGFGELKLGMLPPSLDQITVGDMDRSRFQGLKALFILGFGEEGFPRVVQDHGLLLEKERAELQGTMWLAPDGLRQLCEQQFRLYILLSAPTEALYVSYDASLEKGEPKRASLYWSRFLQIHGDKVLDTEPEKRLSLAEPCFQRWCESEEKNAQLQRWFLRHGYAQRMQRLAQAGRIEEERISEETAHRLWQPDSWELSVTRMERYASCPYAHFLRYGLRLRERELFQASFASDGRILHGILEGAGLLLQRFYDENAGAEAITDLVQKLFQESEQEYASYQDNSRYRYYWRKLQRRAVRALQYLREQVEAGSFRPEYFEWGFGSGRGKSLPPVEVPLEGGQVLRMSGIIDRVDLLQEDGVTYVRIIDYKSGSTSFSETEIDDGISLQLPVYMQAVTDGLREMGREVKPAGMFYFHLTPDIIKAKKPMGEEDAEEIARKGARLSGIAVNDKIVLEGMAQDPQQLQNILQLRVTKAGAVHKSDMGKLRTEEEMNGLTKFAIQKIAGLAQEELSGCIRQYPYRGDTYSACTYCAYREACSFDIRQEGAEERWAIKEKKEEFWQKIREVQQDDRSGRP